MLPNVIQPADTRAGIQYPNSPLGTIAHQTTAPGSQSLKKVREAQSVTLLPVKKWGSFLMFSGSLDEGGREAWYFPLRKASTAW